jgi:hypothetical protein
MRLSLLLLLLNPPPPPLLPVSLALRSNQLPKSPRPALDIPLPASTRVVLRVLCVTAPRVALKADRVTCLMTAPDVCALFARDAWYF